MLGALGPGTASTDLAQWLLCAECWRQLAQTLPRTRPPQPLGTPRRRQLVHSTQRMQHWEGPKLSWHHECCGPRKEGGCSQQGDMMDGNIGTGSARPGCQRASTACSARAEPAHTTQLLPLNALACPASPCSIYQHPGDQRAGNQAPELEASGADGQQSQECAGQRGHRQTVPWCHGRSHPRRWHS